MRGVKVLYLGSNLFSDKATHKNKHLRKISFSNDILSFWIMPAKVLMVFVYPFLSGRMLLTHSCNTCYFLRSLYFFFFWYITKQYPEKFDYNWVAVIVVGNVLIVVVNAFQLYFALVYLFN